MLRHSTVDDALHDTVDDAAEPSPPSRRVAGQRPSARRAAIAAAAREPIAPGPIDVGEPPVRGWAVAQPDPPAVDDLIPFYPDDPRPPRTRSAVARRVIVTGCAVAVLAGAGTAGYLVTHRPANHHAATPAPSQQRASSRSAAPSPPSSVQRAEAWIRANLPKSARMRADTHVSADLAANGYYAAQLYNPFGSQDVGSFVVTTGDIRDRVAHDGARIADQIGPLPVAVFGTGAQQVDVSLLIAGRVTDLPGRLSRQADTRVAADRGLLDNPRVTTDPAARQWLTQGRLDLRAALVVALLAERTDVRVARITLDPVEASAGRAARTVTLSMRDPAALGAVLRTLPPPYSPARVSTLPGDQRLLSWPIGLAPETEF